MGEQYQIVVGDPDRIRVGLAMQLVAISTGVTIEEMAAGGRRRLRAGRARWLALYLAHVGFGWTLERVGHAFGFNRATVANACKWVEDRRDDPVLDRLMDDLAETIRAVCEGPKLDLSSVEHHSTHTVPEAA